jgi:hypothetical protein
VASSWYRFNLLGAMFSGISLVSATSSYADDIAHIKILRRLDVLAVIADGVSVFLSFFMGLRTSGCL